MHWIKISGSILLFFLLAHCAHAGTVTVVTTPAEDAALLSELAAAKDSRTPEQFITDTVRTLLREYLNQQASRRNQETIRALENASDAKKNAIRQLLGLN